MKIISTLQFFSLISTCLMLHSSQLQSKESSTKPNIIFILADDLGYMDLAAYASKIKNIDRSELFYETPHIDQLVDQGVMFTQAYASNLCSPSRSSIITGKHSSRHGFMTATPGFYETHYNQGQIPPAGFAAQDGFFHKTDRAPWPLTQAMTNIALPLDEVTFAEAMTDYKSAFIGKWHLGGHGSKGFAPADQGFEEIAWFDAGGSPYFNWRKRWDLKKKQHEKMAQSELHQGKSGAATGKDYLTDDLAEQACQYIKQNQKSDKPFLLYFCQFAVHTPLQAKKADIKHFAQKKTRGWNQQSNPTYAGMLKAMDDCVGAMIQTLKESNQLDNTIIIFMSDNGGIVHPDENGKATITNNTPLKGEKALLYEGGIRVPLFVWYPSKYTAKTCDRAVDINDIFPTLLDLSGQSLDSYKTYGDGQSLVPLLADPQSKAYSRDSFYWHYPFYVQVGLTKGALTAPRSAIRQGDWKLILNWEGGLELYNLKSDLAEANNLSQHEPERTKQLFKKLNHWINSTVETRYIPIRNPNYKAQLKQARSFKNIFSAHQSPWPLGRTSRIKTSE